MMNCVRQLYDFIQFKQASQTLFFYNRAKRVRKEETCMTTTKKAYTKPTVKAVKIDKAVMVAASRSGMGNCKITYVS